VEEGRRRSNILRNKVLCVKVQPGDKENVRVSRKRAEKGLKGKGSGLGKRRKGTQPTPRTPRENNPPQKHNKTKHTPNHPQPQKRAWGEKKIYRVDVKVEGGREVRNGCTVIREGSMPGLGSRYG